MRRLPAVTISQRLRSAHGNSARKCQVAVGVDKAVDLSWKPTCDAGRSLAPLRLRWAYDVYARATSLFEFSGRVIYSLPFRVCRLYIQ